MECETNYIADVLLEVRRKSCQIDTVIVTSKGLYVYEIKNYKGEYVIEDGEMRMLRSSWMVFNPRTQLKNTETMVRILLEKHRIQMPVYAFVVFMHPNFVLYNMQPDQQILVPALFEGHLSELNQIKAPLKPVHRKVTQLVLDHHVDDNRFIRLPEYSFESLKKRIVCSRCEKVIEEVGVRTTVCHMCGFKDMNTAIIARKANELRLLFPKQKLTTLRVFDWCGGIYSKYSIQSVLAKKYKECGSKKGKYYC